MNLYDRSVGSRFGHVEQGIMRILAGKEPLPPEIREAPFDQYAKHIGVAILVALLVSLAWAIRTIRRWWRTVGPPRPLTATIAVAAPLLLDLFVLWLVFDYAASYFDSPVQGFFAAAPDATLVVVPGLFLAGLWGPIRTAIYVFLLVRQRRRGGLTTVPT